MHARVGDDEYDIADFEEKSREDVYGAPPRHVFMLCTITGATIRVAPGRPYPTAGRASLDSLILVHIYIQTHTPYQKSFGVGLGPIRPRWSNPPSDTNAVR